MGHTFGGVRSYWGSKEYGISPRKERVGGGGLSLGNLVQFHEFTPNF